MSPGERRETRFRERVEAWVTRLKVKPEQVRIQRMTRKWASCSTRGRVTFSRSLLVRPHDFQDYVIVHELLHLRLPNHGRVFKALVRVHLGSRKYRH